MKKEATDLDTTAIDSLTQSSIPVNGNFHFGCPELTTYSFYEEIGCDSAESKNSRMVSCFQKLHETDSITLPSIIKKEFIEIGNYENINFYDSLLRITTNGKFRLPNMEIYECYYTYNHRGYQYAFREFPGYKKDVHYHQCTDAGNLILYNPVTKHAKVLNVFIELLTHDTGFSRYFFIDENKAIQIINMSSTECSSVVTEKYLVNVSNTGEIIVKLDTAWANTPEGIRNKKRYFNEDI